MTDITNIVKSVYSGTTKIKSAFLFEDDTISVELLDGRRSYYKFKDGQIFLYKETELSNGGTISYHTLRFRQILRDGKLKGVINE